MVDFPASYVSLQEGNDDQSWQNLAESHLQQNPRIGNATINGLKGYIHGMYRQLGGLYATYQDLNSVYGVYIVNLLGYILPTTI